MKITKRHNKTIRLLLVIPFVVLDTEKAARGGRNPNPNAPFVAVTRNGQLLPEVKQALAVIAKNDFTLASGHVLAEEALLVFSEAKAVGVQRLIATHAADLTGKMTL